MSESNEIVLRQVPGREATASEIARSRESFAVTPTSRTLPPPRRMWPPGQWRS